MESQIRHHGLDPAEAMICIAPPKSKTSTTSRDSDGDDDEVDENEEFIVSTDHILSIIDRHASSTAVILLPGVQYFTGQFFDMQLITQHAHSKGIDVVAWDLAHAVGNVELKLHDWQVDFAVWCNYKYVGAGPGVIAGLFVHEKHGSVYHHHHHSPENALDRGHDSGNGHVDHNGNGSSGGCGELKYQPRLTGWWGGDRATRFQMNNREFFLSPTQDAKSSFFFLLPSNYSLTLLLWEMKISCRFPVQQGFKSRTHPSWT